MFCFRVRYLPAFRLCFLALLALAAGDAYGQTVSLAGQLEAALQQVDSGKLADEAKSQGDAARGAVVFFRPDVGCSKCHSVNDPAMAKGGEFLGPNLTQLKSDASGSHLVESVLFPSKVIREGYATTSILTVDGRLLTGILKKETDQALILRTADSNSAEIAIALEEVDQVQPQNVSLMPTGQVNSLGSRQAFLDLIRYLIEIREGGPARAAELTPNASQLVLAVPEYEQHVDHAGLIAAWDQKSFERGEAVYSRVCANCHGTVDQPGSLPTSLRFASGKFKNGSDPLSMYRTLTYGFGFMTPQTWMVPSQKYDVIHYIREKYLKPHNASQYFPVDKDYISGLPEGDAFGPEPSKIQPWSAMDYGPNLTHTYQIPGPRENFAYKGIAVRLDAGAGGVSRGNHWMIFDTDTLRMAAGWSARPGSEQNFIDWRGIQFDGTHGVHPRVVGKVAFQNSTGPGWANPHTEQFADDQRVLGRDGKRYGLLPREWGRYQGMYRHGQEIVFSYQIDDCQILESPSIAYGKSNTSSSLLLRTFNLGPRTRELLLQVAEHPTDGEQTLTASNDGLSVLFGPKNQDQASEEPKQLSFDGNAYLEISDAEKFDFNQQDFSIAAKIKTSSDGTIFAVTEPGPKWVPNGQAFFVRGGKLGFDIGWVGAVSGKSKVADDKWHDVRMSWKAESQTVELYVDGRLDGQGTLAAKETLEKPIVRIGYTSPNFPRESFFKGEIKHVEFFQASDAELISDENVYQWDLRDAKGNHVVGQGRGAPVALVQRGDSKANVAAGPLLAGILPQVPGMRWEHRGCRLLLRIPAGETPLRFTLWQPTGFEDAAEGSQREVGLNDDQRLQGLVASTTAVDRDLSLLTQGGASLWGQVLKTKLARGAEAGPFAADELVAPEQNPWLAQTRFTGLDFFDDGRIAVCGWDGDVWLVEVNEPAQDLTWQRIASGLFQPLGLRIIDEQIYVMCRDQLVKLHDLNADGETDFYECFNNDHQVTEHFHEFAMGLQTDAENNFYYAKSGQHGLAAIVPHHGTLLKIASDGSKTDILANGFRAANGVCLNPDGSFFVTDQEGFWNPKNRINWVTIDPSGGPKFYGNMLGYHQVEDSSDDAMEPPLCWITNAMDRSPGELMWVDSPKWGDLDGALLNLSYGYGKVFVVLPQRVGDLMQGGIVELPIKSFETGVMRGRFSPIDQQLYLCGMFAWAGNATKPGGLYRLRPTGKPHHLPLELRANKLGVKLRFGEAIDAESADVEQVKVKVWNLKRTANYGSKHFDERYLEVRNVSVTDDGHSVFLQVDGLEPTWCMEIAYELKSANGDPVRGVIHNTIHELEN